jgi:hypothetical protein
MSVNVSFTVPGKAVSKSNYRHSAKGRAEWSRVIQYQQLVGLSAIAAGAKRHMGTGRVYVRVLLVNQPIDPDEIFALIEGLYGGVLRREQTRSIQVAWTEDGGPVRAEYRISWEEE